MELRGVELRLKNRVAAPIVHQAPGVFRRASLDAARKQVPRQLLYLDRLVHPVTVRRLCEPTVAVCWFTV